MTPAVICADGTSTSQGSATITPSGRTIVWSIQGNALGCTVGSSTGLVTAGSTGGTITVRATDSVLANCYSEASLTLIELTSATKKAAPDGTANTRINIGVAEEVDLTASQTVSWTATAGSPLTATGTTLTWTAPETAQDVTITAGPCSITFHVIAPIDLTYEKVPRPEGAPANIPATDANGNITLPANQNGAGMVLQVTANPTSVCFDNVDIKEQTCNAENITGYFTQFPAANLAHPPNPDWSPIDDQNHFYDLAYDPGDAPAATNGSFEWNIPSHYKARTTAPTAAGIPLPDTVSQKFNRTDNGAKYTISKGAASCTRNLTTNTYE